MKVIIYFSLVLLFVLSSCENNNTIRNNEDNNQSAPVKAKDSVYYWVNTDYLQCVKSGVSVCKCDKKYDLLNIDTVNQYVNIIPGIFDLSTEKKFNFKYKINKKGYYSFKPQSYVDSIWFFIKNDTLWLDDNNKKYIFAKKGFRTSIDDLDLILAESVLNAKYLLNYPYSYDTDSTEVFFTSKEYKGFLKNVQVELFCAYDLKEPHLVIRFSDTIAKHYQLKYRKNYILIYEDTRVNIHDELEFTKLKKQIMYRFPKK